MHSLTDEQKQKLEDNIVRAIKELRSERPNDVISLVRITSKSASYCNLPFEAYARHYDKALQRLRKRGGHLFHGRMLGKKFKQTWDVVDGF